MPDMLNEFEIKHRLYATISKVYNREPLSLSELNIWLDFVRIPLQIESATQDQIQQGLAQVRNLLKQYAQQQQ